MTETKIKRTYNDPRYKSRPSKDPQEVRVTIHGTVKRKHYKTALAAIKIFCKQYQ